ncbi:hypothetical protein ACO0K3_03660 [Undibacterium sp. Rencai35W]|uniref:hypothetical protein n=1 Tax=Undibacterium sp. Rencai35W TaxID=3413046 RepID=UPI003BF325A9
MKLATEIKPRADGTVIAHIDDKITYEFVGQPLTCDVEDDSHCAFLLNTGSFFPADAADFERAEMALSSVLDKAAASDEGNDDASDDPDETIVINNGAPVEALTPKNTNKAATKAKR